jgi:hypothetical protein
MERSDKFSWCICKRCGTLVSFNIKENINMCRNCNNDDVAVIQTPYAFKLFIQELETMGIQPRLNTEDIDMPVDQAELIRDERIDEDDGDSDASDASDDADGDDANADADANSRGTKAVNAANADDDNNKIEDIDPLNLFNSKIDNFTTKNTIIDVKVWVDTFSNNFDGAAGAMKGGGESEEDEDENEDEEDEDEDEDEDDDTTTVEEDDDGDEDSGDDDSGDDDSDDEKSEETARGGESEGGCGSGSSSSGDSNYEDDGIEELWEYTDSKTGNSGENKTGGSDGGAVNEYIKEIHITM